MLLFNKSKITKYKLHSFGTCSLQYSGVIGLRYSRYKVCCYCTIILNFLCCISDLLNLKSNVNNKLSLYFRVNDYLDVKEVEDDRNPVSILSEKLKTKVLYILKHWNVLALSPHKDLFAKKSKLSKPITYRDI